MIERCVYQWGRLALAFYPAALWRWQKEWDYRARYGHFRGQSW